MTGGRSDTSLAAALLTQRLVEASAPPLKASEYWEVMSHLSDAAELLGAGVSELTALLGGNTALAERVAVLLDAATSFAFELDRVEQSGISVLASVDDEFPAELLRLGRSAPPLLYAAGDSSLLQMVLLGIVGSRDVNEECAQAAQNAARAAVEHGLGVVSGGAKGVDRLAMNAALDAGGRAVGVLADSLLRTLREPDVRRAITDAAVCLCTPFKPSAGFSVANAMGRNKLIYALAAATLVVSSDLDRGGTWAGATEALRQRTSPVLVWRGPGATAGNVRLSELGAVPVASVDELFPLPDAPAEPAEPADGPGHQLAMEV